MGPITEPHIRGLLDVMYSSGLSTVLVETLEQICIRYGVFFEQSSTFLVNCLKVCFIFVFQHSISDANHSRPVTRQHIYGSF